jgi:hypothetical protein
MSFLATDAVFKPSRAARVKALNKHNKEFELRVDYFEPRVTELEVYMLEAAEAFKAGDHVKVLQILALYHPKNQLAKHSLDCCLLSARTIMEEEAYLDAASA